MICILYIDLLMAYKSIVIFWPMIYFKKYENNSKNYIYSEHKIEQLCSENRPISLH